ncbi:hypothetical protein AMJ85_12075 [candidate division BRC1 bacterium SM23_51]|nr:MAG: hypothetical protein AMJ85_12075 [candidate division BRC1 bacterium SM23_51]
MDLLVDSHAHLTDEAFASDLVEVLERAALAGIDRVVAVAETLDNAERAAVLARRHDMLAATAGVHPHHADSWTEECEGRLASFSTRANQRRALRDQVRLAKTIGLPIVVHCRDAYDDLIDVLAGEAPLPSGGVVHCFCGTAEQARRIVALGLHLGIGGMVTFRKADDLRRVLSEAVPLERLLLETDSPYLAPEPERGRRNEPAYVRYVAEALARTRSTDLSEIASCTRRNAMALFGLGLEISPSSIAYVLGDSLYLNLTNRCTNDCVFCARTTACRLGEYDLRLPREPSAAEIIAAIGDRPDAFHEVVFCGYGEPTIRLEPLLWVGQWLKAHGVKRVRLNTNGHGNAIHGRSIVNELASVVDVVSVSLNAAAASEYTRLCRPSEARFDFDEVCRFIAEAKAAIGEVVASAVAYPGVDLEACRALAEDTLGVCFRRRPYRLPRR